MAVYLIRVNLPPSLRLITCFSLKLKCFVYNHTTPTISEKLRPKGVAMYAYSVSIYYTYPGSHLMLTWVEPFKLNAKIKLVSNFVVDNESYFFFDA